jgi:hypothetical protein
MGCTRFVGLVAGTHSSLRSAPVAEMEQALQQDSARLVLLAWF